MITHKRTRHRRKLVGNQSPVIRRHAGETSLKASSAPLSLSSSLLNPRHYPNNDLLTIIRRFSRARPRDEAPAYARHSRLLLRQVPGEAAPGWRHGAHHQPPPGGVSAAFRMAGRILTAPLLLIKAILWEFRQCTDWLTRPRPAPPMKPRREADQLTSASLKPCLTGGFPVS
jgi:hypothetical protein